MKLKLLEKEKMILITVKTIIKKAQNNKFSGSREKTNLVYLQGKIAVKIILLNKLGDTSLLNESENLILNNLKNLVFSDANQ